MARTDFIVVKVTIGDGKSEWYMYYISTSIVAACTVVRGERPSTDKVSGKQVVSQGASTVEFPELEEGLRWAVSHKPTGDPGKDSHYLATFPRPSRRPGARRR